MESDFCGKQLEVIITIINSINNSNKRTFCYDVSDISMFDDDCQTSLWYFASYSLSFTSDL